MNLKRLLVLNQADSYTEAAYRLKISEAHLRRNIRSMEDSVGFRLVARKSGGAFRLTDEAKRWLRSFDELRQSLMSLEETIGNAHRAYHKTVIGVNPCLAFSHTLREKFLDPSTRSGSLDPIFKFNLNEQHLLSGACEAFISCLPSTHKQLSSRVLYQEPLVYYQSNGDNAQPSTNGLTVILWSLMTEARALDLLRDTLGFQNKETRFIRAANATEALQFSSQPDAVFPSILLSQGLPPKNVSALPFQKNATTPVYLISRLRPPLKPAVNEFFQISK
ncbi:MAG: LysR family transcriptional regulator [Akkermansiaceae bacterium]|nr:LysR family transcriptional regulator [Akkermansiaceae bacterium]